MPAITTFPQGSPIWVDLQSTDPVSGAEFYAALFGWETRQPTEETGTYWMAFLNGFPVAAIGDLPPMLAEQGGRSVWTTYLAVDNADTAAAAVTDAGGSVLMPPGDLGNGVRLLIAADPAGAVVGLWEQGGDGMEWLRNEPGAPSWFELLGAEVESALPFYERVLGLKVSKIPMDDGPDYTMLEVGADGVAGAYTFETPGHWQIYFEVTDIDATAARVAELGGNVLGDVQAAEGIGRWVVAVDPQGAAFSLLQSA